MKPLSASKRARLMAEKTAEVRRRLAGSVPSAVGWVDCRATTRKPGAVALTGCGERLARIRFDPGPVVVFEIRAPFHVEAGVIVLDARASMGTPMVPVKPEGDRAWIRCAACGGTTTVNLAALPGACAR